jgi:hypothetical protein
VAQMAHTAHWQDIVSSRLYICNPYRTAACRYPYTGTKASCDNSLVYGPQGLAPGSVNLAGPAQTVAPNNWAELAKASAGYSGLVSLLTSIWRLAATVTGVWRVGFSQAAHAAAAAAAAAAAVSARKHKSQASICMPVLQ